MKQRFLKNLLIYPKFQFTLLLSFISLTVVNIILFYLSTQYFFSVFRDKGAELGIPPQHIFFRFVSQLEGEMNVIFLIATIISLVLLTVIGLVISHRIAGPLYRLSKDLGQMRANGKFQKITFRKGDYCLDLAKDFNEVVDAANK